MATKWYEARLVATMPWAVIVRLKINGKTMDKQAENGLHMRLPQNSLVLISEIDGKRKVVAR